MKKYFLSFLLLSAGLLATAQTPDLRNDGPEVTEQYSAKVKVFPNPATNLVNILGLKNTARAAIEIFDIYGNTVSAYHWAIRRNAVNIPISSLEPGAYIVSIVSEQQRIRIKFYKK
ncbi:T9SS type A sorting domain-containing protein [Pricia sp. S334]|uniref:T9SS type A sorting domain-containing protein n=1 Tax=Pricia mediterranea TaxID=3076079 RepID=A0ABU3L8G3_9FLAO|nr:T9SS type A sorting domain-containing protein [Pricia sp. S334]MDT7829508.1 T9SS type A sorting domain-containing protein [Pricia sp. S334]